MGGEKESRRVIAVCGGAVAGSEAAAVCAERGALVLVFEQNARPYGKIEDGLPRWHDKLRTSEYGRIDENLSRENVIFVPKTRLGVDLAFDEARHGLSATLLACGAWRDRPLGLDGIDRFERRGLAYQNDFVYWFNHQTEPDYAGPRHEVPDGAIVVGGGLASIDVAKIMSFEIFGRALRARGVESDVVELEHHGIREHAEKHGIDVDSLGVTGPTLFYRRRKKDMPLTPAVEVKNDAMREKIEGARLKIIEKLERKYLVKIHELAAPVAPISGDDHLGGLVFRRTEIAGGKCNLIDGTDFEVRAGLTVSSIGSIPEPIAGVPQRGELFAYTDFEVGTLEGLERTFGLGNALTGRGNIHDSRKNAKSVATKVMDMPLPELSASEIDAVLDKVRARQRAVGYDGDYRAWIDAHPPLERRGG
jgi:hypothetical protein